MQMNGIKKNSFQIRQKCPLEEMSLIPLYTIRYNKCRGEIPQSIMTIYK
ncbi:unnamed protein product [Meloidogyne enterolobii]|uniref:Uncharacterized protein n=1 Tax=Meloidogyne enterolobii TaxID=390850 RepID=A0ACB0Y9T6_MELEN